MQRLPKIVSRLPLDQLWRDNGWLDASRLRYLKATDIREMIRLGPVEFVVANCGEPIRWIPLEQCFSFWKGEVQTHLADPNADIFLDDFPAGYCYFASEWSGRLVVLEMNH